MNPKSLAMTWLKRLPVLFGLVCFAAVVWFAGPLLPVGGAYPLDPAGVRIAIIAAGVLVIGLFYLVRFIRRRRAEKAIEAAMTASGGKAGDEEVLKSRMSEAIATLKRTGGKQTFLYELPWYVIIGPPGSGKTTALVNSGLKFPLAGKDGAQAIAGLGGTRYCDYWFTEDAVLIDTAGRYTTQDSDADVDSRSWLSFLKLLKDNRPKQPINGVLIAISVEEILTLPPDELAANANAIRKRLYELHGELKIDFPVYALFTKADLIEGFREYFGNFTENRRRKVWGATFSGEDRTKNHVSEMPAEFDALVRRLTEEMPDRLNEEPDATARIAIFGFPAQFAALRDKVAEFLNLIFEPTRYQANANLRGFYFSSGTQEGTPIDQVLGVMGRNLAVEVGREHLSRRGKSFFLHDLLTSVIFSESGWVSVDRSAVRRATMLRYGALTAIAVVMLGMLGAWGWSYANNKALINQVNNAIDNYRVAAAPELARDTIAAADPVGGADLAAIAKLLAELGTIPTGYVTPDKSTPLGESFGLSQRDALAAASEVSYRNALERMLRSRLIVRLEQQIAASLDDPNAVYEGLKVYLMLGGKARTVEDDFVIAWMTQDWEANLLPGRANELARQQLTQNLRAMLDLGRSHSPQFELNGQLVAEAQASLARMKLADRAYLLIKSSAYAAGLRDYNLASEAGLDAARVFTTRDGTDLSAVTIPGLYTYTGFNNFFFQQLDAVANKLESEQWVMGDAGQQPGVGDQFKQLGPALLEAYSRDFISIWDKTIANLKLQSFVDDKPDYQVLAAASSAATSPIRQLIESIARETALTQSTEAPADETGAAGAPGQGGAAGAANAAKSAASSAGSSAGGLARIGIDLALKKSQARAGELANNSPAVSNPGANIEAYFKPYRDWVEGQPGSRPIDLLLKNLDDVRQSLIFVASYPSQADEANKGLGLQLATLQGNVSRLPGGFKPMIAQAVKEFEGAEASGSKAQINRDLASTVTKLCQRVVVGKYPFDRSAKAESQISEFVQLFGPNGAMEKFFAEHLTPLVDTSDGNWGWNKDNRLAQGLAIDQLRQFQRADDIQHAFFAGSSPLPDVQVTIAGNTTSPGTGAILSVNGVSIANGFGGDLPGSPPFPGSGLPGTANLNLTPELPDRDNHLGADGPWALMRLIDQGTVSPPRNGQRIVRFVVGGREVSFKLRVGTSYDSLFLPALADFKCPTGF